MVYLDCNLEVLGMNANLRSRTNSRGESSRMGLPMSFMWMVKVSTNSLKLSIVMVYLFVFRATETIGEY